MTIARRKFIAILGTLGLGALLPKTARAKEQVPEYYPHLVTVLEQQNKLYLPGMSGWGLSRTEKENLAYACERIKPSNHAELAFIVAVGPRWERNNDLIDEYARRRAGQASRLPEYALPKFDAWALPDTYGIPVYREQLVALLSELTDMSKRHSTERMYDFLQSRGNIPPLVTMASANCASRFSAAEFAQYEHLIKVCAPSALSYTYCSAMASRAEKLAREGSV